MESELVNGRIPIEIRPNMVVWIEGLPVDLTAKEAERIAGLVKAMAVIGEDHGGKR